MNHTLLARSAAAAAVIGMLSVSAPAFAQSTQSTQGTTPSNATQSTTMENPQACKNGNPINPPPSDAQVSNTTGKPTTVCKADMKKYKGMVKTNQSQQATNPNAGVPNTTSGGTVPTVPGTTPVTTPITTPEIAPAATQTTTVAPSTGANQGTMTNTLTDNPNGPNWLAKFNRPVVAQRHRRHLSHALGTTTNSGQPPR